MIVKSFVLKQRSIAQIAALCDESTIAVVRPGKKIEALFRETIRKTVVEKKQAFDEIVAIREHFCAMATGDEYVQKVDETVDTIATYLREAMYVQTTAYALEDYVLAKCSRLCAEAVYHQVGGTLLDGTQLMICHQDAHGNQHFDWAASKEQITRRCKDVKGPIVIAGGYGMLDSGYVTRVGKDGAHMMAALIAAVLGAESIEFHIEAPGVAGIPILVKNIEDEAFEGTIISTGSAHKTDVISDKGLILVTVYGTGLLGRVGMSGGIFSCLAAAGVNVRFIAQTSSEYSISFAINKADKDAALEAIRGLFQDNPLLPLDDVVVLNQAVGIVTVFGSRMRNLPGTSGNVFGKLGAAGINIIASAQGGEELSISLVVNEADTDKATELLK